MIERVQNAIYKLERIGLQVGKELNEYIKNNFEVKTDEKILRYLPILYKYVEVLLFNERTCLKINDGCYSDLNKILGEINRITVFNERHRLGITVENNYEWALQHPDCLTYSRWNKLSHMICESLGVKIVIEKKMCDMTYNLSKDIVNCDTFAAISLYNKACQIGLKIQKDEIKCNTEYKLLISKYPDCNLSYKLYKELKDCNMTYDIIETIICKGGHDLEILGNDVIMNSALGHFNLNKDIAVQNIIEPGKIASTLCKIRGTNKIGGKQFMELLASDYKLNQENKDILLKTLIGKNGH